MTNKIVFLMNADHGGFPGWKMEQILGKMTSWEERTSPKAIAHVVDRWKEIVAIVNKNEQKFYNIRRYPEITNDLASFIDIAIVRAEMEFEFESYDGREDSPSIVLTNQEWIRLDDYLEDLSVLDFLENRDEV